MTLCHTATRSQDEKVLPGRWLGIAEMKQVGEARARVCGPLESLKGRDFRVVCGHTWQVLHREEKGQIIALAPRL